jgi:hypothetical protein
MNWQGQYYSAQMCNSESDIDALYHFSDGPGGFAFYRSQIPAPEIWPMAVLVDVEVPRRLCRQGVGTATVERFIDAARSKGALLAFLRVSWSGEMSEREWRVSWYRHLGWQLLRNPVEYLVIPFMCREL